MPESEPEIHTLHSYPPPGDPHRHQPPLHHSPQCSAPDNIIIIVFKYLPTLPSIILIPLCYIGDPKADNNWLCRKIFGIYDILYIVPPVRNKFTRHILKREATPFKNFMQIDNLIDNLCIF